MQQTKTNLLTDDDITDEQYDNILVPFNNNFDEFLKLYVIPEIFCFQLAQSYYRKCLCKATLIQHYSSMTDVTNLFPSIDEIMPRTIDLLNIKYNLKITNNNPLTLERWR